MLIGDRYADNKIYRGVKHYDKMPLTSGDIHESADTDYMKNAYIMNSLLGYGTLNTPDIVESAEGLRLSEPSVVMIDGDVSLIQSDDTQPLVTKSTITSLGYSEGTICIVGWYQHISVSSTLRNYGGVDNSILPNDLMDSRFPTAISSRFQLRWFPYIVKTADISGSSITIKIKDRDIDGNKLTTESTISSISKKDNVFTLSKPSSMTYAESDLYLIPLAEYKYSTSAAALTDYHPYNKLRAGYPFITSETEPTGMIADGTRWYNPVTREFKTYVSASGGFVDSASKMAFLQYQSIHVVDTPTVSPQDIVVPVGVSSFQEGDILRVIYEGLELAKDLNYTIDYTNKTVKLLSFTTNVGDIVYFTVTRVVEATDITNVTETFVSHMASKGSATIEAHVKLSDTLSNADVTDGIAATPKMVNSLKTTLSSDISTVSTGLSTLSSQVDTKISEAKTTAATDATTKVNAAKTELNGKITELSGKLNIVTDDVTGKSYKLGVNNGNIYLEEV